MAATGKKKKKVTPIDQAFIEKMDVSLSGLKAEIIEKLIASNEDFKEIVDGTDPKDLADVASDDIDRKMIEAIGSQELKRLKLIDSAITRIKQGKYGLCIKCGKRIPSTGRPRARDGCSPGTTTWSPPTPTRCCRRTGSGRC